MYRVAPVATETPLQDLPAQQLRSLLRAQLPIWVHNIITDPDFPERRKLLMPLRRFEGELNDSKNDEVVSVVLNSGFKNQTLDPFNLPKTIPMRQRCALLVHIRVWQEAYRRLENDIVDIMSANTAAISSWCELARLETRVGGAVSA